MRSLPPSLAALGLVLTLTCAPAQAQPSQSSPPQPARRATGVLGQLHDLIENHGQGSAGAFLAALSASGDRFLDRRLARAAAITAPTPPSPQVRQLLEGLSMLRVRGREVQMRRSRALILRTRESLTRFETESRFRFASVKEITPIEGVRVIPRLSKQGEVGASKRPRQEGIADQLRFGKTSRPAPGPRLSKSSAPYGPKGQAPAPAPGWGEAPRQSAPVQRSSPASQAGIPQAARAQAESPRVEAQTQAPIQAPEVQQQAAGASGLSAAQLREIMPRLSAGDAQRFLPYLTRAMNEAQINTPLRRAAFLAQIAHESSELQDWVEQGARRYFNRYEPGTRVARNLGNTRRGDGYRYRGRGPVQLTGRDNYTRAGRALGLNLAANPDQVSQPSAGFRTAAWFWSTKGLNGFADRGDFRGLTQRLNGGLNGFSDRTTYYLRARRVLGA